jgi:hypothetical protein
MRVAGLDYVGLCQRFQVSAVPGAPKHGRKSTALSCIARNGAANSPSTINSRFSLTPWSPSSLPSLSRMACIKSSPDDIGPGYHVRARRSFCRCFNALQTSAEECDADSDVDGMPGFEPLNGGTTPMLSRVIPTVRDPFLARNFNTLVEQSEQRHQSTRTLFIRSAGTPCRSQAARTWAIHIAGVPLSWSHEDREGRKICVRLSVACHSGGCGFQPARPADAGGEHDVGRRRR